MESNVTVIIRVRPLTTDDAEDTIISTSKNSIIVQTGEDKQKDYEFDFVVDSRDPEQNQQYIANLTVPKIVNNVKNGIDTCVLAYGQTAAGKSFTMTGIPGHLGLIPRVTRELFKVANTTMYAQYVEIYNNKVYDLFAEPVINQTVEFDNNLSVNRTFDKSNFKRQQNLINQIDPSVLKPIHNQTIIKQINSQQDSTVVKLDEYQDLASALLYGLSHRTTSSTELNQASSRSHAIFTLFYEFQDGQKLIKSQLSLVDLAGSERLDLHLKYDQLRIRETQCIGHSLQQLGHVIRAVSTKQSHIPFRNSVLTKILEAPLSNQVYFIANITPDATCLRETIQTLQYASQMKLFQAKLKANTEVVGSDALQIALTREIEDLQGRVRELEANLQQSEIEKAAKIEQLEMKSLQDTVNRKTIADLTRQLAVADQLQISQKKQVSLLQKQQQITQLANEPLCTVPQLQLYREGQPLLVPIGCSVIGSVVQKAETITAGLVNLGLVWLSSGQVVAEPVTLESLEFKSGDMKQVTACDIIVLSNLANIEVAAGLMCYARLDKEIEQFQPLMMLSILVLATLEPGVTFSGERLTLIGGKVYRDGTESGQYQLITAGLQVEIKRKSTHLRRVRVVANIALFATEGLTVIINGGTGFLWMIRQNGCK